MLGYDAPLHIGRMERRGEGGPLGVQGDALPGLGLVVTAMSELGVDLGEAFPKPLTGDLVVAADVVITMGCGDACPIYPGRRYEDWELDDPAPPRRHRRARAAPRGRALSSDGR